MQQESGTGICNNVNYCLYRDPFRSARESEISSCSFLIGDCAINLRIISALWRRSKVMIDRSLAKKILLITDSHLYDERAFTMIEDITLHINLSPISISLYKYHVYIMYYTFYQFIWKHRLHLPSKTNKCFHLALTSVINKIFS